MSTNPTTVLTWEEWRSRLEEAAPVADKLIALAEEMSPGRPGQSVLALMLAARALCAACPALPGFGWYFQRVSELRSRELGDRGPPS
jgi:hypothetical protein